MYISLQMVSLKIKVCLISYSTLLQMLERCLDGPIARKKLLPLNV